MRLSAQEIFSTIMRPVFRCLFVLVIAVTVFCLLIFGRISLPYEKDIVDNLRSHIHHEVHEEQQCKHSVTLSGIDKDLKVQASGSYLSALPSHKFPSAKIEESGTVCSPSVKLAKVMCGKLSDRTTGFILLLSNGRSLIGASTNTSETRFTFSSPSTGTMPVIQIPCADQACRTLEAQVLLSSSEECRSPIVNLQRLIFGDDSHVTCIKPDSTLLKVRRNFQVDGYEKELVLKFGSDGDPLELMIGSSRYSIHREHGCVASEEIPF